MLKVYKKIGRLVFSYGTSKLTAYLIVSLLLVMTAALATMSVSPLMKVAMGGQASAGNKLSTVLVIFCVAQLALFVVSSVGEWFKNHYTSRFGAWLRVEMLSKVVKRPYQYFTSTDSSVIQLTVNNYSSSVAFIVNQAMDLIIKMILIVGFGSVAVFMNPLFSCVLLSVGVAYYFLVITFFGKVRKKVSDQMCVAADEAQSLSMQTIQGIKMLRVSQREDIFVDQYKQVAQNFAQQQVIPSMLTVLPKYLLEFVLMMVFGLYLYWLDSRGELMSNLPQLSVLLFVVFKVFPLMQGAYSLYNSLMTQDFIISKVSKEFEESSVSTTKIENLSFKKSIELKGLMYAYEGVDKAIVFPDFKVRKGETLGVQGASGSGKSTMMDLILGLYEPRAGSVLVDGNPVKSEQLRGLYGEIGYVGQDSFLLNLSIAENIALEKPDKIDQKLLIKSAELAQILEHIDSLPDRFDTMVGDRGVKLSGGQRQRLAIARALYSEPSILFLDEATSALDETTEKSIMDTVYSLPDEITIIMIAHRLSTLERADRIIELG